MHVAKSTHGLVSISQCLSAGGWGSQQCGESPQPRSSQGSRSLSSGISSGTSLQAELPPQELQTQEPTPLRVRTQKNLLSVQTAFRRPGSAAESTFNLLSNYIMEEETNYCLFPHLLQVSFTGFILPLNRFSSETVFQLNSHFWKCLQPNDNSNKIYYTHLLVLNSTFPDGYILSVHLGNETWPEMWRIREDARYDEQAAALLAAIQLLI